MKNQYFGDVNDFRKYGLLRVLQADGSGKLLVAWMLTPDDGSRDGSLRSYLRDAERWRHHDPQLFDGLVDLLPGGAVPAVSLIEGSGLIPRADFYAETVPDTRAGREAWRDNLFTAAQGADVVFLDPDNGIEVPSRPVGRSRSSKHVTWSEIEGLWAVGCSVLIYQHFRREPRDSFARRFAGELAERTGARYVEAFRTSHVLFVLALQEHHVREYGDVSAALSKRWERQITPMGLASLDGDHREAGVNLPS